MRGSCLFWFDLGFIAGTALDHARTQRCAQNQNACGGRSRCAERFVKIFVDALPVISDPSRILGCALHRSPAGLCLVASSGGKGSRLLIYTSYPLEVRNEGITRAFILLHGTSRNADDHFRTALAAAFLANSLNDTVIIAPRFAASGGDTGNGGGACRDVLAPHEANWNCEVQLPNSWRSGGTEIGGGLTSYDYIDELLRSLGSKEAFPNLRVIVFAGHSAGAQFVVRYQMSNRIHEKLRVPVSYIAANSSGYPYLDQMRPTVSALPRNIVAVAPGYTPVLPVNPPPPFGPFVDARNCISFDDWPYGLKNRTGYSLASTDAQLTQQIVERHPTFLLGEYDILPLAGFDGSCSAMAQGPTRLARGLAFARYLQERFQAHPTVVVVPLCGHNARCMFTADIVLPLIFPTQ
jgi:pimeloyl-ACP methyl ester carboxylesterase